MTLRLSLQIPLDAGYIRTTRLLSRCPLQDMNVNSPIIDDVKTIVAELCANVVFHAQSKATHFLVTLEYRKPQVIITVVDEGEGFAQADVLPAGTSRPDGTGGERYGGYGLSLIEGPSENSISPRPTHTERRCAWRRTCTLRLRRLPTRPPTRPPSGTQTTAAS